MPRILIGALSAWKYADRRERCLKTWIADAESSGVQVYFLLTRPELSRPEVIGPHQLAVPGREGYNHLTQATRAFCQWAVGSEAGEKARNGEREPPESSLSPFHPFSPSPPQWDYLFKCDDDTFVSIPRLLSYDFQGRDYLGAEWRPGVGYGSGGAGYFLSRRAAEIVAERLTATSGSEDLEVGRVLRQAGVKFSIEPRFVPWGTLNHRPKKGNDLITVHACAAAFSPAHAETGLIASQPQPMVSTAVHDL